MFVKQNYESFTDDLFTIIYSFDNNYYICKTSAKKIKKQHVPCQAAYNTLWAFHLPHEFRDIRRLEKVPIARRLLFKKITILPKGESPELKGTMCNVPVDVAGVCNNLSHASDSNGLVIVKL